MLINFTNHPSAKWSDEQMQAAITTYGSVIDFTFPQVLPTDTTDAIKEKTTDFLTNIKQFISESPETAHAVLVLGEFVFTYQMVRLLELNNIAAVSTVTTREVIEEGEKKISIFRFLGYRSYF